jgi:LacI family transcriptional regulator
MKRVPSSLSETKPSHPHSPTVYDVAHLAEVSIATVSRVLNAPNRVRESTRNRVIQAIDELGFVPKADATARARKTVGRIGVLTPFFTSPSFVQRMRGMAAALTNTSFELVIYPVDSLARLEEYLFMLPVTRRLDGLIIIASPLKSPADQRLLTNHLEAILIEYSHPSFSSILIDDFQGGVLAARFLLEKGHRRFAFVGPGNLPPYSLHPEDKRQAGFQKTLEEFGLSLPQISIKYPAVSHPDIHQEFSELIDLPDPPTAIFAASDDLAIRLLRAAREHGMEVPGDLAILGFDDIEMAELIGLTTISQSLDESGRMAAEMILDRLSNPDRPTRTVQLNLKVVKRETA